MATLVEELRDTFRPSTLALRERAAAEITRLQAEVERELAIARQGRKCPIGLEDSYSICSAGYCDVCVAARFAELQSSLSTLKARVRKVIEPFAEEAQFFTHELHTDNYPFCEDINVGHLRAARSFANELKEE